MSTSNKQPFFGTGWAFPISFTKMSVQHKGNPKADLMSDYCTVEMAADIKDIEQSLTILLTTRPGERVMRPDYGCSLEDLLFEPINLSLRTYVEKLVDSAILYYEPRIKLNKVDIREDESLLEGRLKVSVDFTVRSTNSRFNYVYDFYTREATILAQ
jgi:phage baseplate assembly protein W